MSNIRTTTTTTNALRQLRDVLSAASNNIGGNDQGAPGQSTEIEAKTIGNLVAWTVTESIGHPLRTLLDLKSGFILVTKGGSQRVIECRCSKISEDETGQIVREFAFPLDSEAVIPVEKDMARLFLSQCNQLSELPAVTRFSVIWPVFVLCSLPSRYSAGSTTNDRLSYLGLSMGRLQSESPLSIITVESCGISTELDIPFSAVSLVHDFMDDYSAFDKASPATQAYAKYSLLESTEPNTSSVSLDVTWNSIQKLLSAPSFVTSMTMIISYVPGKIDTENHTHAERLRIELEKVACFQCMACASLSPTNDWKDAFNSIGNTASRNNLARFLLDSGLDGADEDGLVESLVGAERDGKEKKEVVLALVDRVDSFLEEIRFNDVEEATSTIGGLVSDISAVDSSLQKVLFPARTDMDFTDKLWTFCAGATSYEDLCNALTIICKALQTGDIQPMYETA
ncbi:UNVERIFIED_CONTAM: hypothetical protein HDU68_010586 [Siphonaria sp. JEL0065]|nr:hypothetical protein HDU68_010586 [Siphonaria sp. JEL0065]